MPKRFGEVDDAPFFADGSIPQEEKIKEKDPVTYEALKRLAEGLAEHGRMLNDKIGGNEVILGPPPDYNIHPVLAFNTGDNVHSVPPPPTPLTDPALPADPTDINSATRPQRLDIVNVSRSRRTRALEPRG